MASRNDDVKSLNSQSKHFTARVKYIYFIANVPNVFSAGDLCLPQVTSAEDCDCTLPGVALLLRV